MTTSVFEQFLAQNKPRVFKADAPVDERHIGAAEKRLGVMLPASYKTFLRVCGSGSWGREVVPSPEDIYAFDDNCDDMEGFVGLVHNVRGVGDFVAMNPREQTEPGEWALYYCSHDPAGYGRIADSFESWAREAVTAFETGEDIYVKATDDVWRTYRGMRAKTKKWWQFWL
jgi:hypothetical protein